MLKVVSDKPPNEVVAHIERWGVSAAAFMGDEDLRFVHGPAPTEPSPAYTT